MANRYLRRKRRRLPTHHAFTEAAWLAVISVTMFLTPGYLQLGGVPAMMLEGAGWVALLVSTVRASAEICKSLRLRSHRSLVFGLLGLILAAAVHVLQEGLIISESGITSARIATLLFLLLGSGLMANGISLLIEPDPSQREDRSLHQSMELAKAATRISLFVFLLTFNSCAAITRILLYLV